MNKPQSIEERIRDLQYAINLAESFKRHCGTPEIMIYWGEFIERCRKEIEETKHGLQ